MSMTNVEGKLDFLGIEMQRQTVMMQGMNTVLGEISNNTKSLSNSMEQDQAARETIYSRLTDGILKLARVLGVGMFLILSILCVALFKLNFVAEHGSSSVKIGSESR